MFILFLVRVGLLSGHPLGKELLTWLSISMFPLFFFFYFFLLFLYFSPAIFPFIIPQTWTQLFLVRASTYIHLRQYLFKRCFLFTYIPNSCLSYMSRVMRKQTFCICENKDKDQLRDDRETDQRLCYRYIDSTIPLLSKSEISCL